MFKAIFNVRRDDIEHGVRCSCEYCPIARSGLRLFHDSEVRISGPGLGGVALSVKPANPFYEQCLAFGTLPEEAACLMAEFDVGDPCDPLLFVADMEPECETEEIWDESGNLLAVKYYPMGYKQEY